MELSAFVEDFADALAEVDRSRLSHKHFQPGIGPFGEADAIRAALPELRKKNFDRYEKAVMKRLPDLLIPGSWAFELKIIRPFGDNGMPAGARSSLQMLPSLWSAHPVHCIRLRHQK